MNFLPEAREHTDIQFPLLNWYYWLSAQQEQILCNVSSQELTIDRYEIKLDTMPKLQQSDPRSLALLQLCPKTLVPIDI